MIKQETAREIVRQQENLDLTWEIRKRAESGMPICVSVIDGDDIYSIEPGKELILPLLESCAKHVNRHIRELNIKAKEELNDVTQKN